LSKLAGVATGNALISGGVSTAPSWGKIGLTTHVSGILPVANGGTNSSAALSNNRLMRSSGGAITELAAQTAKNVAYYDSNGLPTGQTLLTYEPTNSLFWIASESTNAARGLLSGQHNTGANGANFRIRKSRGSKASPGAVTNGDALGALGCDVYDGSGSYVLNGAIRFTVDGAVSAGTVPVSINFINSATSGGGGSGFGTERLVIKPAGHVMVGDGTGTPGVATAGGDLYVADALEADGASNLAGAVTIGGGTAITKVLSATATLDFGSTAAGAVSDLTITVTGAADGNVVSIGVPNGSIVASGTFFGWVSASNTVTVRYANNDLTTARDPASGTFRAMVTQF
jgi:hypothetical protein